VKNLNMPYKFHSSYDNCKLSLSLAGSTQPLMPFSLNSDIKKDMLKGTGKIHSIVILLI
jgi:hypothetical protein